MGFKLSVAVFVVTGVFLPLSAGTSAAGAEVTQATHWGAMFGAGLGAKDTLLSPTPLSLPGPIVQVATSNSTQYALLRDGAVYAWGLGDDGQLGDDSTSNSFNTPVQVRFPVGVTIASLPTDAMPFNTGLAIDTAGHVWGWGLNQGGELCQGNSDPHLTPVELPLTEVTAAAGAGDHALYDSDGTLYACGDNAFGDLGDGTTRPSTTPVAVTALPSRTAIVALVASYEDSGALLADGGYFDWGVNNFGQLGDGTEIPSAIPVEVNLPLPVDQVAQGADWSSNGQTLVLLSDGSLRSWGDDSCGQLGDHQEGPSALELSPIRFDPPAGVVYRQLATGGLTSYAVSTTGTVYSWGCSSQGEVGNGSTTTAIYPVAVESGVSSISSTAMGIAAAGPAVLGNAVRHADDGKASSEVVHRDVKGEHRTP